MLVAAFLTSATFAQCPSQAKKDKKSDEKSCCEKTEKSDAK
jgi:hypothetical protein